MKKIKSWNDVTIADFIQISQILRIEDEIWRVAELIKYINGINEELTIEQFNRLRETISFMTEKINKQAKIESVYVIGETKYVLCKDLSKVTVAQYIDYTNYSQNNNEYDKLSNIMSVLLIPEGHKYNDGYDIEKVKQEIENNMSIVDCFSIGFFLQRQSLNYIRNFLQSSTKTMKMTKEQRQQISILCQNMVYYR